MEQDINIKLEELFIALDNSSLIKNLDYYKNKILMNKSLMDKINKIKSLNKYDPAYKELKLDIYKDNDYKNYIKLEQELNYLIMDINSKFKNIIGDRHEDN